MEYRKVFDTIPEQFDANRPRYCRELFEALIAHADVGPHTKVLELGPIMETGCDYEAIGSYLRIPTYCI